MNKKLKVLLIVLLSLLIISFTLLSCLQLKYINLKRDFIGKTSNEIQSKYGEFDNRYTPPDADGVYRNTVCSYNVIDARVGFLGTEPPYLLSIRFDADGIAYEIFFQQGGLGG